MILLEEFYVQEFEEIKVQKEYIEKVKNINEKQPRKSQDLRGLIMRAGHTDKKKTTPLSRCGLGTSMGTRTPVFAVRGRRLDRLTMEASGSRTRIRT